MLGKKTKSKKRRVVMVLTNRQSLFLLVICLMANKVQRLPSLISTSVGRHGWLIYLALGIIDVIFLHTQL